MFPYNWQQYQTKMMLTYLSNQYNKHNLNKQILLNVTKFMSNFLCFTKFYDE